MRSTSSLPEGWEETANYGTLIDNTMFVPLKTPLNERAWRHKKAFSVQDFINEQEEMFNRQIGCMIDFTNTQAYYTQQDVPDSVSYVKMRTAGHDVWISIVL